METETLSRGTIARVVQAIDAEIYDVSRHVGRLGIVMEEDDGLTVLRFSNREVEGFWPEELEVYAVPIVLSVQARAS